MAVMNSDRQGGYTASADLSAKQFHFAVVSGERTLTFAGTAGLLCVGVIGNKPLAGQPIELLIGPEPKITCSAALAAGAKISTNNAGQAKAAATGENILGTLGEASPGAGAVCAFFFEPGAIAP